MRSKFKWIYTLLVVFTMQFSFAQEKIVSGIVSDSSGPIPGANVRVKGTSRGTQTDVDGKYSIKATQGETLVFSFVGNADQSKQVGAANSYNVTLASDAKVLDEVVIGALGIKRPKDAVPSAQKQIGNRELTQAANPNAIQSLSGKVSGLQVSTIGSGVNGGTRIILRGNRTITGSNEALVVIDNAISSNAVLSQLPPDVIESMNIIKGAQGAALYGAQGVNGVIIVTTKRGSKSEKLTVGVVSAIDFETIAYVPDRQEEYGQGWAADPGFDDPSIPGVLSTFVPWENGSWGPAFNTPGFPAVVPVGLPQADGNFLFTEWKPIKDNIKQFFKTGTLYQNGFNFNVGGQDGYAFLSVNRQNTDFIVQDDQLVRTSFLFKAGKKIGKFSVDGNVNYITQKTSQTDSDLYDDLIQTAANVPVSRFNNPFNEYHWTVYAQSPTWTTKSVRFDDRTNIFNGIINLGYEISKNFNVSYIGNVQMRNTDGQSHRDAFTNIDKEFSIAPYEYYGATTESYQALGGAGSGSSYFANQSSTRNIYGDLLFNFNFDLTPKLNLKFNIGNNIQDSMFRITTQGGNNLDVPGFYHITNVLNPNTADNLDNRLIRNRRVAGFGNLDLAYENYLFLNATARVEQTSLVKNSYFYPSVGVSFIPTKAIASLKDSKVLNYAKINASYTSVGNTTAVGTYQTNDLATIPDGFPFGDLGSLQFNRNPTNPNIKPEFVNTLELGAQLGFFGDRLTIEGSVYTAETKDLITRVTASTPSGIVRELNNVGVLENKGFELDLGIVPIKTKNFKWNINANYSTYKTIVKSLTSDITSVNLQSRGNVGIFAEVGEEFPLIKGTAFVRDANGSIIVDAFGVPQRTSTFEKLGKGVPDYLVGLTNSFEFKGFRFTAVADLRMGASAYSDAKNLLLFTGGDLETAGFDRTQGYVIPNSVTSSGAVNTTTVANNPSAVGVLNYFTTTHRTVGESNIIDASALKIRELSLSYSLSEKILKGTGIESFRVGVNARNPFVFLADGSLLKPKNGLANNGYVDPEASNTSQAIGPQNSGRGFNSNALGIINIGQYPTTRTFGFSVNLTF